MDVHKYLDGRDTANSQDLFASGYTTRQLAYVLADEISIRSNNPERVTFLEEYNFGPMLGWIRGSICRALDEKGVTVQTINRRKS
ncbi:hypothetical protein ABT096_29550 [Streptomyces sp. NPDC002561]|uniref:hypothetical protein n=1 Tax=Streptomyces sp. NPDC002561 TaxID=3154418 RepID=UPI0033225374